MPADSISVQFGSGRALMRVDEIEIFDDHDLMSSLTGVFPAGFPQAAVVSFVIEWEGILDRQQIRNEMQNFEGTFLQTGSTMQWEARNPATGFTFVSEPPDPGGNVYAVIAHERNGRFFT